jgi:uncharacterized protein YcbK (DUF882 family)
MLLRLGVAVALVGLVMGTETAAVAAQPDEAEGEPEGIDEPERPTDAPQDGTGEEPEKAPLKASGKRRGKGRKRVEGHVVKEDRLRRRLPPPPSGNVWLHRPIEGDSLKVNIYNPDGSYNGDAVRAASRMLRCRRTNTDKDMEPRLLAILSHVFDHFGERRIDVISGFRNQRKTSSYHYKASASDIRVDGVSARRLKEFVETLDAGGMGIGIYPITGFVHIDVRPPPSYRWTDYSRSNPDAEQKKPPPWVKRRRLQS